MDIQPQRPASPLSCAPQVEEPMETSHDKAGVWLADHARMVKAYTLLDGQGKDLLSLPAAIRQQVVGPEAWKSLYADSEKKNWQVTTYRSGKSELSSMPEDESPILYQSIIDELLAVRDTMIGIDKNQQQRAEAAGRPVPDSIMRYFDELEGTGPVTFSYNEAELTCKKAHRKNFEAFICDPSPSAKYGSIQVTLPEIHEVRDGKKLIIYFDHPRLGLSEDDPSKKVGSKSKRATPKYSGAQLIPVASGKRFCGVRSSADDVRLNPQEWAVLSKHGRNWDLEFKVVRRGEHLLTNPLALESSPLLVSRQDQLSWKENDGEYYLNREMITSLYEAKLERARERAEASGTEPELLPWCYQTSQGSYQQLAELGDNYHFIFERSNVAHSLGVYVKVDRGNQEVNVYLHETEGADDPASLRIREQITAMMTELYPDLRLHLFYPKETLQRDFASCGVFALKAMNYFRKNPKIMDQWMQSMKAGGTDNNGVNECAVALQAIKPGLLKMFHGRLAPKNPDEPRLTPGQLESKVCKDGTTLHDYLFRYEREVLKTNGRSTTTVNTGPLVRRYMMMDEFQRLREQQLKKSSCTLIVESEVAGPSTSAGSKRKAAPETPDFDCPQEIIDSLDRKVSNKWLKSKGGQLFSPGEWEGLMRYERYDGLTKKLKEKHPKTYRWLKKTRRNASEDTPKGYLICQWINIPEAKSKEKISKKSGL